MEKNHKILCQVSMLAILVAHCHFYWTHPISIFLADCHWYMSAKSVQLFLHILLIWGHLSETWLCYWTTKWCQFGDGGTLYIKYKYYAYGCGRCVMLISDKNGLVSFTLRRHWNSAWLSHFQYPKTLYYAHL